MSEPSSSSTSPSPSINGEEPPPTPENEDALRSRTMDKYKVNLVSTRSVNIQRRGRGQRTTFLSSDPMKIGLIGKKGSLSTVVRALQQKKLERKQGTLEKSKLDWQEFKREEGIEEELQIQIRSKNGYLERQDFLQRTDLRQFEYEKELRAKKRRLDNPEN